MTPRQRTLLAVGLFIPLAGILLATFACLPAPVGDPEQAKVDDKLTGAWLGVAKEEADKSPVPLVLLRPYDGHTYFLQYIYSETKDDADAIKIKTSVLSYKAWLTPLGGATFITCETLDDSDFLATGAESNRYYWVAKIERKDDTLIATPVKENSDFLKDLKTREKIEAAIKANINDKALYGDAMTFKKLDKDHMQVVEDMRKKANLGIH